MGASEHVEWFQKCDSARCHTAQQAWRRWVAALLAHFREDRFGIPLIAAMSAFSPSISLSSKMRVPAKL